MFNSLSGILTFKKQDQLFIDINGMEWDIGIPLSTFSQLPETGAKVKVFTYFYLREDKARLFGFATEAERNLFLDLLKVEGVGPSLALKILSGIKVNDFISALDLEDIDRLSSVPGLGKKTAQKIVLKLRGKLTSDSSSKEDLFTSDIVNALAGMGFDPKNSKKVVLESLDAINKEDFTKEELEKELIKVSIKKLGSY